MPDVVNAGGLQTKSLLDILSELETAYRNIYGADINLEQNSPDGQLLNIFAQQLVDLRELLMQIYNSFDPDKASGAALDSRVAINNIQRRGGTFTIVGVEVTTDRTVTLSGLDGDFNDPNGSGYTVQDDAGTQFVLADTTTLSAGTTLLTFRARDLGAVEVTSGTITTPVDIVIGVVSVNNPSAAIETGANEETDAQLRVRRAASVSNNAIGYLDALQGSLLSLDGVTDARVFENKTDVTDGDGLLPHSILAVVEGGANDEIAQAIYAKKNYGANLNGVVTVMVERPVGGFFEAKFDRPQAESLYIQFDLKPTASGQVFDVAAIADYIADNLSYVIGEAADTSRITCLAQEAIVALGGKGVALNVEISIDDSTWEDYLETSDIRNKFTVDAGDITITEV